MWFLIVAIAQAAPEIGEAQGWTDSTLLVGATETVYYRPEQPEPQDESGLRAEEWFVKCSAPPDGPMRCWDFGGPHLADSSPVQCVAPADEPRFCLDSTKPERGRHTLGTRAEWDAWVEEQTMSIGSDLVRFEDRSFGFALIRDGGEPEFVESTGDFQVAANERVAYSVQLTRGDQSWTWDTTATVSALDQTETFGLSPYWSTDGKRIAVLEHHRGASDEAEPDPATLRIHQAFTPLLSVLAHQSFSADASRAACKTVASQAGMVFQNAGLTKRVLAHSVVSYAEGYKEQAQAVAEAVPGGATLEPLSWHTHGGHAGAEECRHFCGQPDLILELGASADADRALEAKDDERGRTSPRPRAK